MGDEAAMPKIGLGAAMALKKKAQQITKQDRVIDAKLWTSNVSDMVQVMNVAQGLYVVLEQCNEAVLRVAVELCTCRQARKALWWPDSWEGDFDKRELLKGMIKEKIALAISAVNGRSAGAQAKAGGMGEREIAALKKRAEEKEAAAAAATKLQKIAEVESREAKQAAEDALAQVAELQKSLDKMKEDLRRNAGDAGAAAEAGRAAAEAEAAQKQKLLEEAARKAMEQEKMLADLERRLREAEAARRKLEEAAGIPPPVQQVVAVQEEVVRADTSGQEKGPKDAEARASTAEAKARKLEAELKKAQKEIEDLMAELAKLKEKKEKPAKVVPTGDGGAAAAAAMAEAEELREQLEEEQKRSAKLEDDLQSERDASAKLRRELEDALARLAEAEKRAYDAEAALAEAQGKPPPKTPPPKEVVRVADNSAELEELRQKCKDFDKLQARLAKRDKEIAALKAENAELKEQNEAMLKTLAALKAQLKKVMEIAEKKGLGKLVNDLMAEAGLTDTLNSDEFSWFMRLYKDALRRIQKWKEFEKDKFISQPTTQTKMNVTNLGFEAPGENKEIVAPRLSPVNISDPMAQQREAASPSRGSRSPSKNDMGMTGMNSMTRTSSKFRASSRAPTASTRGEFPRGDFRDSPSHRGASPSHGKTPRDRSLGERSDGDNLTPAGRPLGQIQVVGVSAVPRPNTPLGFGGNFPPPPLGGSGGSAPDLRSGMAKHSQTFTAGFRPGVFSGASPKSSANDWAELPEPVTSPVWARSASAQVAGSSRQRSASKSRALAASLEPGGARQFPGPSPMFLAPYEASSSPPPPALGSRMPLSRRWSRDSWNPAPEAAKEAPADFLHLAGQSIRSPVAARPGSGPGKLDPINQVN